MKTCSASVPEYLSCIEFSPNTTISINLSGLHFAYRRWTEQKDGCPFGQGAKLEASWFTQRCIGCVCRLCLAQASWWASQCFLRGFHGFTIVSYDSWEPKVENLEQANQKVPEDLKDWYAWWTDHWEGQGKPRKWKNCMSELETVWNRSRVLYSKSKARREESGLHKPSHNQVKYLSTPAKPKLQTQLLHPLFAVPRDLPWSMGRSERLGFLCACTPAFCLRFCAHFGYFGVKLKQVERVPADCGASSSKKWREEGSTRSRKYSSPFKIPGSQVARKNLSGKEEGWQGPAACLDRLVKSNDQRCLGYTLHILYSKLFS